MTIVGRWSRRRSGGRGQSERLVPPNGRACLDGVRGEGERPGEPGLGGNLAVPRRVFAHGDLVALLAALGTAAFLAPVPGGHAHETDHFTPPPPRPFADLGPYFTGLMCDKLAAAAAQTNVRIIEAQRRGAAGELDQLRTPDAIAQAVCQQFGVAGFYITDLDLSLRDPVFRRRYPGLTVAYWPSPCVYDRALLVPIDPRKLYLLWRASVINIGGVRVGTDKIGHFIHHGYNYYLAYRAARRAGRDDAECRREAAAIATGGHLFFSERMLLGTLTSGVVSNGDLAANYIGLLFYLNLTEEVRVRGVPRPALLRLEDGLWRLAPHVHSQSDFFTVFIDDHMDEALNPNLYDGLTAAIMRGVITKWCAALRAWYADVNGEPRPPGWFRRRAEELHTYYGEDYGHIGGDGLVGLATVCDCAAELPADPVAQLHAALGAGDLRRVDALLTAGINPNALLSPEYAALGIPGDAPLATAIRNGQARLLERLLRAGADLNARTLRGTTALHLAAGDAACTAVLLRAGADVQARDALGRTPLHRAVQKGQLDVARLLLKAGVDPNASDCDGQTPLHDAVRNGSLELVRLLLDHGAAVDATGLYGETALHVAAQTGRQELVGLLLDAGAPPGPADEFGSTPLHRAVAGDHESVAHLLLHRGAAVNTPDVNGTTALHLAARTGRADLLDALLEHGANPTARNALGRTPLTEARAAGQAAVVERLARATYGARWSASPVAPAAHEEDGP